MAATNADLDARAREGSFRADLLYRLKVCPVAIPPLRDRREDIAAIAQHFAEKLSGSLGGRAAGITAEAMAALERYPWPGNVRELRNVVHSALIVAMDAPIGLEHFPSEIAGAAGPAALDRARLEEALARARFNRSEAAMLLGVSRTTLWRQMRRAGLR